MDDLGTQLRTCRESRRPAGTERLESRLFFEPLFQIMKAYTRDIMIVSGPRTDPITPRTNNKNKRRARRLLRI